MVIRIRDLECYSRATNEERTGRLIRPDNGFDLSKLKSKVLQSEMEEYIYYRGRQIALSSLRTELGNYNAFCRAINDILPDSSILALPGDVLEKELQSWLMKKNRPVIMKRKRADRTVQSYQKSPVITYARRVRKYFSEKDECHDIHSDVWYLDRLGIRLRENPVSRVKSINFEPIQQAALREETKRIIKMHLQEKAVGTVTSEMAAVKRFSRWLAEEYPDVDTYRMLTRDIIERYLEHTNIYAMERLDYSSELAHLRSVLDTASHILEDPMMSWLLLRSDLPRRRYPAYRFYSEEEIRRLNRAISNYAEEQVARALFVHQMLGTRISETLTLKKTDIGSSRSGKDQITIHQVKTGRMYEKLLSPEMKKLLEAAIQYTESRYGACEYIFVDEKNPKEPMKYAKIKYTLRVMIRKYDLRDDHGKLFTVGTHIWRHTYAKRLAEMDVDDLTIASLLGQSDTSSVRYYRKMAPKMLGDETRGVRKEMDEMIKRIRREWDDEG